MKCSIIILMLAIGVNCEIFKFPDVLNGAPLQPLIKLKDRGMSMENYRVFGIRQLTEIPL